VRVWDFGCIVCGLDSRVLGLGSGVQGLRIGKGFLVRGLRYRVCGLGSGFRVKGL
jgi:hypothetical protein